MAVAEIFFILTAFFPLAYFYSDTSTYRLYLYEIRNMVPVTGNLFSRYATLPLILLCAAGVFLTVWAMVNYRNRLFQVKINKINILFTIFLVGGIFFFYPAFIEREINTSAEFTTGAYFPLLSLLLLILANRFIMKDEKLVRSMDRLR